MTAELHQLQISRLRSFALKGARVALTSQIAKPLTMTVRGESIVALEPPQSRHPPGAAIDLSGYIVLPGLINAHDHLDFSLYPQLGHGPYPNWREWARDIYRPDESPVKELLSVPREVRLWWGGIRNLLAGVTTVSQHDRPIPEVLERGFPVHVPPEYGWAHSTADAGEAADRFSRTSRSWPFLIHVAEGTDAFAADEFERLCETVELDDRVALVHAVGLTADQWERVRQQNLGIVWCPLSNLFTLGRTLDIERIKSLGNVALGTDSPLTASGDLLDHIRFLHQSMRVPPALLYLLVTRRAASLLKLRHGEGRLASGCRASFFAVRDRGAAPADSLVELKWSDVELVIEAGRIVLLAPELAARLPGVFTRHLESLRINGTERLIAAPVAELIAQTSHSLGFPFKLAGREVGYGPRSRAEVEEPKRSPARCTPIVTRMSSETSLG